MKNNRKSIVIYLLLVFTISYLFEILAVMPWYAKVNTGEITDPTRAALVMALVSACMFIPTVSVLLTRVITNDWKNCYLRPNFKGNLIPYLIGWFGPLVLVIIGAAVWFAFNPEVFTSFTNPYAEKVPGVGGIVIFVALLLLSPLLNCVACFGEEWGWRGFLMPRLHEEYSFFKASMLTGLIWGLWHAPLIAAGHNYHQIYGVSSVWMVLAAIGAMCILSMVLAVLFGYISERAHSVWPAVLAHGCLNGVAGLPLMFTSVMYDPTSLTDGTQSSFNPFVGPLSTGIIGGSAFIVVAIVILIVMHRRERKESV